MGEYREPETFFAWGYFQVLNCIHRHRVGGLWHLEGGNSSTLNILPFWQTGQVETSMPVILSNSSCQVSFFSFSGSVVLHVPRSSRHKVMVSLRLLFASSPK